MKEPTRRVTARDITANLVEEAADGMPDAAGILADFIYGWVKTVLKSSSDVDDATQEAFLAVLVAVREGRFHPDLGKASAWVTRVSVNKAIDFLRRHKRYLNTADLDESIDEVQNPKEHHPDSAVDVHDAINNLNEVERTILLLRHYEDFSFEEISETLLIPVGTVKSRLFRVRAKLRTLVGSQALPASKEET